jgi:dienelactone hydrolase
MHEETLTYQADGLTMRSQLFFDSAPATRAGVLVFPEAFGLNARAVAHAKRLASLGYVALACDLHGEGRVIDDLQDTMTTLQPLFDNPIRIRDRATAALRVFAERPEVDAARIAAIGFCFPMPLELARSGADIKAVVGFHTGLSTKLPVVDPGSIKPHVLVCIGGDDPFIPPSHRAEFESEMRKVGARWQMNIYGNTVHSFTIEDAAKRNKPEAIRYNPEASARAWASALDLFERVLK